MLENHGIRFGRYLFVVTEQQEGSIESHLFFLEFSVTP